MRAAFITDEELVAEMRARGLAGPVSAEFLIGYRQDREFVELAAEVEAIPNGPEKLCMALIQAGVLPPDEPDDQRLLAAWTRLINTEAAWDAATEDADPIHEAIWDAVDDVIDACPAVTLRGAIVKLSRALLLMTLSKPVNEAIRRGDHAGAYGARHTLNYPEALVIDALAAIELTLAKEVSA